MIITVGSTNPAKVLAVRGCLEDTSHFLYAKVISLAVDSDVSEQPISLRETIQGAKNRAKNAFNQCCCNYSIGIEAGLMETAEAASGYLHVTACCIYDGTKHYTGLSTAFEIPSCILDLILNQNMDMTQACLQSGISNNAKIGSTEGLIGILTKGKMDRKEFSKQAVMATIVQLENIDWYVPNQNSTIKETALDPIISAELTSTT